MKPRFSVIIPVLNESLVINHTIRHVRSVAQGAECEIIVVDGDPKGGTLSSVEDHSAKKILSPPGRGTQMNRGAAAAVNDILLFLHADTELPEEAFLHIASVIEGKSAGGAFDLGIGAEEFIFRIIEKMVYIRTRITGIPYGDQAIFIRKDCFIAAGGFREIPIMEDVEFMKRIRKSGVRLACIPVKVKTSPRRWEREGVLTCTLRNWMLITLYHFGVPPERLVKFYCRQR
jgi:rSAM/selenodomain-associated transferase 2